MRSASLAQTRNTIAYTNKLQSYNSTLTSSTIDVHQTINNKIKTYSNWNYIGSLRLKKSKAAGNQNSFFSDYTRQLKTTSPNKQLFDKNKDKNKNKNGYEELEGVRTQRRQRLKRANSPSQILKHYIQKQAFRPSQQQNILLNRLINIKHTMQKIQPFNIELMLDKIIKTLNAAVDFNQLNFFLLCTLMAAQICYEAKQYKCAFYFYTQSMVTGTCIQNFFVKLQSIKYLGKICIQCLEYQKAIIFFKKALQYAWKIRNVEKQLKLYDLIGKCYYYEGRTQQAQYYHNRFIQGQNQSKQSAVRRISFQMLTQYQKTIDNGEKKNLNQLFLSYLRLPIYNFSIYPSFNKKQKTYPNYVNRESPRKYRVDKKFSIDQLPQLQDQIQKVLKQNQQFKTEIPNPDLHQNFISTRKYGRKRKEIQFEQSNAFHKLQKIQIKKIDKSVLKSPTDQRIVQILNEKLDPNWWQLLVAKSKKQQNQKLGSIRKKIDKSHMSFLSYVSFYGNKKQSQQTKRRAQSLKSQKISQCINKTMLNLIDPQK